MYVSLLMWVCMFVCFTLFFFTSAQNDIHCCRIGCHNKDLGYFLVAQTHTHRYTLHEGGKARECETVAERQTETQSVKRKQIEMMSKNMETNQFSIRFSRSKPTNKKWISKPIICVTGKHVAIKVQRKLPQYIWKVEKLEKSECKCFKSTNQQKKIEKKHPHTHSHTRSSQTKIHLIHLNSLKAPWAFTSMP